MKRLALVLAAMGTFGGATWASPIFSWSFDQPTGFANPADSIPILGTIMNTSGSSETMFFGGSNIAYGTFSPAYTYVSPSFNPLLSFTLSAGGTLDFSFGTFTPNSAPVAPGTYTLLSANTVLQFCSDSALKSCATSQPPTNGFQRTVSAVPEPSSVSFIGLGVVGLGLIAKRKRPF